MSLSNDDLHSGHDTAVATRPPRMGFGSLVDDDVAGGLQSNNSHSDDVSATSSVSPSSVVSRGFMATANRGVGLASILDPGPPHLTSSVDCQPTIYSRLSSRNNLGSNVVQCQNAVIPATLSRGSRRSVDPLDFNQTPSSDLHSEVRCEFCACQTTVVSQSLSTTADQCTGLSPFANSERCRNALGDRVRTNELYNVCDLHGHLRPSYDLQAKGDFNLCRGHQQRPSNDFQPVSGTPPIQQMSPLCCSYVWPSAIASTPARATENSALYLSHTGSSLLDELRPYLSDTDSNITTDDEY